MTAVKSGSIAVDDPTIEEAARTAATIREHDQTAKRLRLALVSEDGESILLPPNVERTLLVALSAIGNDGQVQIGRVPEELTSTAAADLLGVSRPTLMKWVREGRIDSVKVGTHSRFRRDDVLKFRDQRDAERRVAFDAIHDLEDELDQRQ